MCRKELKPITTARHARLVQATYDWRLYVRATCYAYIYLVIIIISSYWWNNCHHHHRRSRRLRHWVTVTNFAARKSDYAHFLYRRRRGVVANRVRWWRAPPPPPQHIQACSCLLLSSQTWLPWCQKLMTFRPARPAACPPPWWRHHSSRRRARKRGVRCRCAIIFRHRKTKSARRAATGR